MMLSLSRRARANSPVCPETAEPAVDVADLVKRRGELIVVVD